MKVSVKTIQRESSQRRHLIPLVLGAGDTKTKQIETGKTLGKVKASNTTESIGFYLVPETGRYKTGLDEMVPNPFKGESIEVLKSHKNLSDKWNPILSVVLNEDTISRQIWYEILDGTEPNFYTSAMSQDFISRRESFDPKKPKTFIEGFQITLYEGLNVFTSDTSRGRMAIQAVKNCPLIAKDKVSVNSDYHTFYIAEENEEALEQVQMFDKENRAIVELYNLQEKFPEDKLYQFACILRDRNDFPLIKGEVAPQIVKQQLNKFIKNKDKDKAANIDKFLKLVDVFKENSLLFEVEYLVTQAINTRTIGEKDGILYWYPKQAETAVYKHRNRDAFKTFILRELENFDPKDPLGNYYYDLKTDLQSKGVKI